MIRHRFFRRLMVGWLIPMLCINPLALSTAQAFDIDTLIETGIDGMFDRACGGYCIVGACAHLAIRVTATGIEYYTIISPKIQHAVPDMVVSTYRHPGQEPWEEWRESFGEVVRRANQGVIASLLGTPDGLQGGRADRKRQDEHQSTSFKEVDVIGHPAALIPQIATLEDIDTDAIFSGYRVPSIDAFPDAADAAEEDAANPDDEFNLSSMMDRALTRTYEAIRGALASFLSTMDFMQYVETLVELFDMITDLIEFYNNVMTILEATTRSTIYANLANPVFRAERIFCPSKVKPFQPYYISYADAFFWRIGFPITDGPISGANHSTTILNPFSSDILGADQKIWGHMYPREGTVNSNHDAKVGSVTAWRGFNVMETDAGKSRVGVKAPGGYASGSERWEMIHPVKRRCTAEPYYPDDAPDKDYMSPNPAGSYAWNVYHVYDCCANTQGTLILEVLLPMPLCFELPH